MGQEGSGRLADRGPEDIVNERLVGTRAAHRVEPVANGGDSGFAQRDREPRGVKFPGRKRPYGGELEQAITVVEGG